MKICQVLPQLSQHWPSISHVIESNKCYKYVWYRNSFSFLEEIPADSRTTSHATFMFLFSFIEVIMSKGHMYNGEEATQRVLDMSTDSNMESEPEEYMDTILHREGVKCVYGRKHGHTESSVTDKDKALDCSLEFEDNVLLLSPQCSLEDLHSTNKCLRSTSPVPSTSMSKPPFRHTSMPMGSVSPVDNVLFSPVASTSVMPKQPCRTSMPVGCASANSTPPFVKPKRPRHTSMPVASASAKSTMLSVTPKHPCHTSMPVGSAPVPSTLPSQPDVGISHTPSDSGSESDSSWDSGHMNISTDSEVQFRQCITEDHYEASGDEHDTLTLGAAGSIADDEDSRSGHAHFMEDYVEDASDADDEPPPEDLPQSPPGTMDALDNNIELPKVMPPPRRRNRGTRWRKEQGPGNQKHIVNFDRDDDYEKDCPMWKQGSTFPKDTIHVPDIAFKPESTSKHSNGLLFDPSGFQPSDFFY